MIAGSLYLLKTVNEWKSPVTMIIVQPSQPVEVLTYYIV